MGVPSWKRCPRGPPRPGQGAPEAHEAELSDSGHRCPAVFPRRHRPYKQNRGVWLRHSAMLNVAVIGARGYLGRECIRILLNHPQVTSITPVSGSEAGKPYGDL